jgi:starch-binding outer membrane protein, SusD/RagB family
MVARSTFDETIAYITKLCDEAAADLPLKHSDANLGRATKGAAMALKARMLLYAASPLWNDPANASDTPWSGKYDAKKWETAAKAAKDVIDLKEYALYQDISTLFLTRTNSEMIFVRMQEPMAYHSATHIPYTLYTGSGAYGVGGVNQVTYNMVQEYEVLKNNVAYSVDDPASGHNFQDPYKNRDPRFYRDCVFNGSKLLLGGTLKTADFGLAEPGGTPGIHNMPYNINSTFNTYVYSTKFADPTLNVTWDARAASRGTRVHQNYPYLRYAEVLLNYAEAMNEAFGPENAGGLGKTALEAVNEVRIRAKYPPASRVEYLGQVGGMPPIAAGLTKDQMRAKIHHERRVEMSYEEHRLWDVNRWKETPVTDIKVEMPLHKKNGTLEYQIKTIETRFFDPNKMYRMPIPQSEILANPLLVQNPGWK